MITIFGVELLGALLAPRSRWPQISWRQDEPNETQNGKLGSIFGDISAAALDPKCGLANFRLCENSNAVAEALERERNAFKGDLAI